MGASLRCLRLFIRFATVLKLHLVNGWASRWRCAGKVSIAVAAFSACLFVLSCASPEAISAFADSAQKALAAGPSIFDDLHGSCVRRQEARPGSPILPLFVPPGSKNAPPKDSPALAACARFAEEAKALANVSDLLSAYFRALQQLAAFNTSTVSTASGSAAQAAAGTAGLNSAQIDSAGKLAGIITRVFTESYQRSRLVEYLRNADAPVAEITQGFDRVIKNYLDFLQEERQTLTARYQAAGTGVSDKAVLLLLNRAYTEDMAEIERRRTSAEAYQDVLKTVREGHHQLVAGAQHLSARELSIALEPYTSKLDGLIPAVEKDK